jgi:phosphinothricin acetyltransferase
MFLNDISIRTASEADAAEIREIYTPYVNDTAITFEYDVPPVEEFAARITRILQSYPFLVAEREGQIIGYTYVSVFRTRAAYDWAVETSIYLRQDCRQEGLGKRLYLLLEEILKKQHILNMYACIAYTAKDDPHLTNDSVAFHEHLGYMVIGHFSKCGYKFNTWYDMVWMEKLIGEHDDEVKAVIPFTEVRAEFGL